MLDALRQVRWGDIQLGRRVAVLVDSPGAHGGKRCSLSVRRGLKEASSSVDKSAGHMICEWPAAAVPKWWPYWRIT